MGLSNQARTRAKVQLVLAVFPSIFRAYSDARSDSVVYVPLIDIRSQIAKKNKVLYNPVKVNYKTYTRGKGQTLKLFLKNPKFFLFVAELEVLTSFGKKIYSLKELVLNYTGKKSSYRAREIELYNLLHTLEFEEILGVKIVAGEKVIFSKPTYRNKK